jgi:hypothetical protein
VAKPSIPLTHERLKQLVHYDPDTGVFIAACDRGAVKTGRTLGTITGKGYRSIMIDWKCYRASRLAWFYMTSEWPPALVDHADRDRLNDRWGNLRLANNSQNGVNAKAPKNNSSGVAGVSWVKRNARWIAYVTVNYRRIYFGSFRSKEEAIAARQAGAVKVFGDFAPSPAA